jgi:hypothetical protein
MAPATSIDAASRKLLTDEIGDLLRDRQIWAPKEKRLKVLMPVLLGWYPDLAANETEIAQGERYEIQIGEKAIEKDWASMDAVYDATGGLDVFKKVCTVTFKSLSGILSRTVCEALQVESQTGHRKLKAVARLSPVIELRKAA